jgi:hypothetical protein
MTNPETGHKTLDEVRRWRREAYEEWARMSEDERRRLEEKLAAELGLKIAEPTRDELERRKAS